MMHRLQHSNIIQLYGYGKTENNNNFIVMELMDGGSMDSGNVYNKLY
jgi:serine/threonine protein kinase